MRRLCVPEKEKSSLRAMPFSKMSRCSLRPTLGMIICRSCTICGFTSASERERKSACFWLLPSRTTLSPGAISFSSMATRSPVGSTLPCTGTDARRRAFSLRRVFHCRVGVCPDNIINLLIQHIILICLTLSKVCALVRKASIKRRT